MIKNKINDLWPITIRPVIDGVSVIYNSNTQSFEHNKKIYKIKLGKRTCLPILGYLFISQIDLEKLNYRRAQSNLPLFENAVEAVLSILEQNKNMYLLSFIACGVIDHKENLISEKKLLQTLGYITMPEYHPDTPLEAVTFLEAFSLKQTQKERAFMFKINENIIFDKLEVYGNHSGFLFCNQNLAVKPVIVGSSHSANAKGEIISYYEFEPITLLGDTFSSFSKPYGELTCLTLVNHKLFDLTDQPKDYLTECPSCGKSLEDRLCTNYFCKEKVIERAYHIASKDGLNIRGLSKSMLRRMYDYLTQVANMPKEHISDVFFFYLSKKDIEQLGIKEPQAKLLLDAIEDALKRQKLTQVIEALQIKGLDKTGAKAISKLYNHNINLLIEDLTKESCHDFEIMTLLKQKIHTLKLINSFVQEIV